MTGPSASHPTPGPGDLQDRFASSLTSRGGLAEGDRIVVALSGGVDSLVLLHLLRFGRDLPHLEVIAAHFDHGMRPDSGYDSQWVRGVCRAWETRLHVGRANPVPTSEDEARKARYDFLLHVMRMESACRLLTGHHADDQAETVLFRVLRGTGLRGLAGIPRRRPPGIFRPLLPFTRGEIQAYARARCVRPRVDPTNIDTTYPRNYLRHIIIPELEAGPAPGAGRSLRRLARLARENEEGWRSILPSLLEGVLVEEEAGVFFVRSRLLAYHPAVRVRILREGLRRRGISLDEAGTRAILEFTNSGASGRSIALAGGFRLTRDFDKFSVTEWEESVEERPLTLAGPSAGTGEVVVGGQKFQVVWGPEEPGGYPMILCSSSSFLRFPLQLRGWMPGDRILLSYGTKKLKKLLAEAKIPVKERARTPVLVDEGGLVLWVAGVASSARIPVREGTEAFFLGIRHVEGS